MADTGQTTVMKKLKFSDMGMKHVPREKYSCYDDLQITNIKSTHSNGVHSKAI